MSLLMVPDEVDSAFNGIKGGGGALLMEKVVVVPTKHYIWVVDESKMVEKLGAFHATSRSCSVWR